MAKLSNKDKMIRCVDCLHATYFQWFENPIVAQCSARNERMVAEAEHNCYLFRDAGPRELVIKHFDHYSKDD